VKYIGEPGVALLTVVGHKMYAPKDIAALSVRVGVQQEAVVHGKDRNAAC
jgi:cysteine desulfurase